MARETIEERKQRLVNEKVLRQRQQKEQRQETFIAGALLNTTTYIIIFLLLIFGLSAREYQRQPDKYSWLDANGDFKTETYDLTVSYNIDTSLDELNGNSLKEVFEDENLVINGIFEDLDDWNFIGVTSNTVNNNILTVVNDGLTIGQRNIYQQFNNTLGDVYIRFDLDVDDIWGWALRQTLWSGTSYYWSGNIDSGNYSISQVVNNVAVNNATFYFVPRTYNITTFNLSNVYAVNLDDLGINQTKDEMDYWYSEYQRLQENRIEDMKYLGGLAVSSWTNTVDVLTTIGGVMEDIYKITPIGLFFGWLVDIDLF